MKLPKKEGVHGFYDDLDGFLGMGLGEIQKKDFDFKKKVEVIDISAPMIPVSTNEAKNFEQFTEQFNKKYATKCNVLFKQGQFFFNMIILE